MMIEVRLFCTICRHALRLQTLVTDSDERERNVLCMVSLIDGCETLYQLYQQLVPTRKSWKKCEKVGIKSDPNNIVHCPSPYEVCDRNN